MGRSSSKAMCWLDAGAPSRVLVWWLVYGLPLGPGSLCLVPIWSPFVWAWYLVPWRRPAVAVHQLFPGWHAPRAASSAAHAYGTRWPQPLNFGALDLDDEGLSSRLPDGLCCPVTRELMREPVGWGGHHRPWCPR